MRKYLLPMIFIVLSVLSLTAQDNKVIHRGEKIDAKGAITTAEFLKQIDGKEELDAKLEAKVISCCMKKGCWMEVDLENGETMRVTFKDYGFFVPFDSPGMTVVMEGTASMQTISVDMLRHYAEDAGKSKEEIMEITESERTLTFEATGLILKPTP